MSLSEIWWGEPPTLPSQPNLRSEPHHHHNHPLQDPNPNLLGGRAYAPQSAPSISRAPTLITPSYLPVPAHPQPAEGFQVFQDTPVFHFSSKAFIDS